MKKTLIPVLLTALMMSCVNNDLKLDGENEGIIPDNKPKSYLSVSLVASGGSRAGETTDDDYQAGSTDENKVNLVRFYFLDTAGAACDVRIDPSNNTKYLSYIDWDPNHESEGSGIITPEQPGTANGTVEKILQTTFTIDLPDEKPKPTRVVAVINPPATIMSKGNLSLGELSNATTIQDYYTGLHSTNFVMSSSVYAGIEGSEEATIPTEPSSPESQPSTQADGKIVTISMVSLEGKWSGSLTEAIKNPVILYVERVLARVDLSITQAQTTLSISDSQNLDVFDTNETIGDNNKKIYVKINGWTVTCDADKSRLMKSIDANWDDDLFGSNEYWTLPKFHRSFWAINPKYKEEFNINIYSYNQIANSQTEGYVGYTVPSISSATSKNISTAYIQENAANYETADDQDPGAGPLYPTEVILTGQLIYEDGTPATIAEWGFQKYTIADLLKYFANKSGLYVRTGNEGNYTYTPISDSYLTFQTTGKYNGVTDNLGVYGGYWSYCVINENTDAAKGATYTDGNSADSKVFTTIKEVNQYLDHSFGTSLVWNNGLNYYFFRIRHLGAEGFPGYYGVVRNHLYDTIVDQLDGLGTPVWDPNEPIFPDKPERGNGLIAAKINVLMWRIVSQNYQLSW